MIGHVAIGDNMHLEMDIRIKEFPNSGWGNILHCGTTNRERYPGIWINSDSKVGFYVKFSDQDNWDRGTSKGETGTVAKNKWYHLEMDITKTTMRVTVNNVVKFYKKKSRHNTYDNMICYFSDPWHAAANVDVRNLKYIPLSGLFVCAHE